MQVFNVCLIPFIRSPIDIRSPIPGAPDTFEAPRRQQRRQQRRTRKMKTGKNFFSLCLQKNFLILFFSPPSRELESRIQGNGVFWCYINSKFYQTTSHFKHSIAFFCHRSRLFLLPFILHPLLTVREKNCKIAFRMKSKNILSIKHMLKDRPSCLIRVFSFVRMFD